MGDDARNIMRRIKIDLTVEDTRCRVCGKLIGNKRIRTCDHHIFRKTLTFLRLRACSCHQQTCSQYRQSFHSIVFLWVRFHRPPGAKRRHADYTYNYKHNPHESIAESYQNISLSYQRQSFRYHLPAGASSESSGCLREEKNSMKATAMATTPRKMNIHSACIAADTS